MPKSIVIVESPTKAKTISKYLGKDYIIESSAGHIKNLPSSKLGIEVDNNYKPSYVTIKGKSALLKKLTEKASKVSEIFIATDPDREGEAIAWHLANELKKKNSVIHRVLFQEITKEAVKHSLDNPTIIDEKLVSAQQARRVMDRLVGYEVSPFLWKAMYRGLSAGRVQSVALRLICEREREIMDFVSEEYWTLDAVFSDSEGQSLKTKLVKINGKDPVISDQVTMNNVLNDLGKSSFTVTSVETKPVKRNPYPPFITSTLQQDASNRLRFSTKKTMMVAQQLYEGIDLQNGDRVGLITYMRTDSVRVSESAVHAVREFISSEYGEKYLPDKPRFYKTSKNAQDAHEAIRPTTIELSPAKIKSSLTSDQFKLYQLIWNRFLASQMAPAQYKQHVIEIGDQSFTFRASSRQVVFNGFLAAYMVELEEEEDIQESLVNLQEGTTVSIGDLDPQQKFTQPPPRFTEASLVKTLEGNGIGRPSTYSSIISTLSERQYTEYKDRKIFATDLGLHVNDILIENFPSLFNYDFTAKMEEELDNIANGNGQYTQVLDSFYLPLRKTLDHLKTQVKAIKESLTEETDIKCEKCGSPMVIKWGRNGKFLACSNYPECKNTKPLNGLTEKAEPVFEPIDKKCTECGGQLGYRAGRYGKFIGCENYPTCKYTERLETPSDSIMTCPDCKEGQIVRRKSRRGKEFFGCNRFPKCKFALWNEPVPESCPQCNHSYLVLKVLKSGNRIDCPNCDYSRPASASA